jgi:4-amino-4-deoxy-L-arabinose transferase-like glycosyltransferase
MRRRTAVIAAAILLAALAIRVVRIEESSGYRPVNDAGTYLTLASQIAHTGDYTLSTRPGVGAGGTRGPSAYFPPGFPYLLAAVDLVDGHAARRGAAVEGARISQAVLGTVVVALTGLVALEALGGAIPALIALALAAVYPVLIELSGILVAENLLTALVLGAVWATLRARRAAKPYLWIAAAGGLAGLAALTHENGILLLLPLAFAVWRQTQPLSERRSRRRLLAPAVLIAAAAVTVAPWTIRNAVVMHRLIPISDETGITLVGTYNSASAANTPVPYKWRIFYGIPGERTLITSASRLTEPQLGDRLQHQALHYIGTHPLSPLVVAYHNTLRLLELEGASAWQASAKAMGLNNRAAHTGVVSFWVLCGLALLGALSPTVRRAPRWLWAVPLLFALSVVLVNVETPRFREPVEPFLILLAACALSWALGRAPVRRDRCAAVAPGDAQLIEVGQRLTGSGGHAGERRLG